MVGDKYKVSTDQDITCIKRTDKQIHLSNGVKVTIKSLKGTDSFYLTSNKTNKRGNKSYNHIDQVLRDIEGYLIYKKHI